MSRSYKKYAIFKDSSASKTKLYWRIIRRVTKQTIKKYIQIEQTYNNPYHKITIYPHIREPKDIIDDYDYCDYIIHYWGVAKNKQELKIYLRK